MKIKVALVLTLISALAFSVIPTLYTDNPAFVFESPRKHLDLSDLNVGIDLTNNLITIDDVNNLLTGKKITFDSTRLELIGSEGFLLLPNVLVSDYINVGLGKLKLGVDAKVSANVTMNLPSEAMSFVFGDYDFGESLDSTFTLFKGGIYSEGGLLLGLKLGSISMALEGGAYVPVVWFDKESVSSFHYSSDEDKGSFEIAISGKQRLYSLLNSLDSSEIDSEELSNSAGYYVNFGAMWDIGDIKIAAAINNYSVKPARLEYAGCATITYEASYSNLKFSSATPVIEYPKGELEKLEEPIEVSIPYEVNLFASYNISAFDIALHGKFVPDIEYSEFGGYLGFRDIIWVDLTMLPNDLWKKEVGLNFDMKYFRLTATAGVIDAGGLLNADLSKMTGMSVKIGFGLGF